MFGSGPGNDSIGDFTTGSDKIDLTIFGITAADISTSASGGTTIIAVDTNHNGASDFTITLLGVGAPAAGDYLF